MTIYVDSALAADCPFPTYSIAARTCDGGDGAARRTINDALDAAADGDTILVRQGVYLETGRGTSKDNITFLINKQITLKTYAREPVTLSFPPDQYPGWKEGIPKGLIAITVPNVTLDGFTLIGTRAVGDVPGDRDVTITIQGNAGRLVIRNNRILEFGHVGIGVPDLSNGPLLVENNEFEGGFTQRDHGIYSIATDGFVKTIRYNYFHDISGYGVHLYAGTNDICPDESKPRNHDVYGNIFVRNHTGGIVVAGPYNRVLNNVFYGNAGVGGLYLDRGGAHHLTIRNNIIWNNKGTNILTEATSCAIGNDFGYNDIGPGPLAPVYRKYYQSSTDVSLEPDFVSAAPYGWADFGLKPGSPLAQAGSDPGAPYNLVLDPSVSDRLGVLSSSRAGFPIGAFAAKP